MIALLLRDLRLAVRAGGGFGLGLAFFLIVVVLVPFGVCCLKVLQGSFCEIAILFVRSFVRLYFGAGEITRLIDRSEGL